MSVVLFWFRSDLRLHDQPALHAACSGDTRHVVPVYCLPDTAEVTPWGFPRLGPHRRAWLIGALNDLCAELARLNCPLLLCPGPAVGADAVVCEDIAAPYEPREIAALRAAGLPVRTIWQSSMLDPAQLPWAPSALPASFTPFRKAIEAARMQPPEPLSQVVAGYPVHELSGDWRASAVWFESLLLDYDVYSNQGNWLYIAGRGTDPRGGRRFNLEMQAAEHDPQGEYRALWSLA